MSFRIYSRLGRPTENLKRGQRPKKVFQVLTDETGIPHLDWQISTITTLMRASADKEQFTELHARAFQLAVPPAQMRLPLPDTPDQPQTTSVPW
jgi:hypothetical protein